LITTREPRGAGHGLVKPLAASLLTLLVGCSAVAQFLGLRIRLDKIPVTALSASLVDKSGAPLAALGPGQSARLVIVATGSDGKPYPSVGAGHGKVALDNYTIAATLVTLGKRGSVSLPSDPRVSEGKIGHLHIVSVAHPGVKADLDIAVRYDIAYAADFSGADGMNGTDGTAGLDGLAGSDGIAGTPDPVTGLSAQGPGGNGGNGSNGGDGGNGWDGSPGQAVHVWVRMAPGARALLQVKVIAGASQSFYLIDPHGGSIKITTDGGRGGQGGQGGRGGNGGSGGSGSPPGFRGSDGLQGSDGRAGSGGAAGTIAISIDPAAQAYLGCMTWSNRSGDGVAGPAPQVTVEPVAPLW
jgi:hypothetical protein